MRETLPSGRRWSHVDRATWLVRWFPADLGLYFLLYYLYVWLVVDPRLICGYQQCSLGFLFLSEWSFLGEHLLRPGGPIEYLARLLYQFYWLGWAGALVMTALALLACLGTDALARGSSPSWCRIARYVPAAILLMMYVSHLPALGLALALLTGLWCFVLYERAASEDSGKRLSLFLLLGAAGLYLAGAAGLLFAVLVAVYELLIAKRPRRMMVAVLCGAGGLWLVNWWQGIPTSTGLFDASRLARLGILAEQELYALALLAFFPAVLAGRTAANGSWTVFRRKPAPQDRRKPAPAPVLSRTWAWVAAVTVSAAAAWFSTDAYRHSLLEIDYCVQQEQRWDQALQVARRMPRVQFDPRANRNILRALVQTGRLGDELFRYPQVVGVDLFSGPDKNPNSSTWLQESQLCFDVGFLSGAERAAYEALAGDAQFPAVLEQLAMVCIAKGQAKTARVFLHALRRHLSYRRTADDLLRRLDEDPRLEQDLQVSGARSLASDKDVTFLLTHEECLLALLETNRHNRRALDLLMAHWLLSGQPEKVAANLWRLPDCGYPQVPRHYQEAVLEQQRGQISFPVPAGRPARVSDNVAASTRIDPEIVRKADRLDEILRRAANWEAAFQDALAAGLGDTYRFYRAFGLSGL